MARPRILRTKLGGEITLKNVDIDTIKKIEGLLENKSVEIQDQEAPALPPMPAAAIGVYADPVARQWATYLVKFDPKSGTAKIAEVFPAQTRGEASERFKIMAVNLNIV